MNPRRRVRCWFCGATARRVQSGSAGVVGRVRVVPTFGVCGFPMSGSLRDRCRKLMMRRSDAAFVLRAAIAHERMGWNRISEYDSW